LTISAFKTNENSGEHVTKLITEVQEMSGQVRESMNQALHAEVAGLKALLTEVTAHRNELREERNEWREVASMALAKLLPPPPLNESQELLALRDPLRKAIDHLEGLLQTTSSASKA
jgi:DNA repair exonuclease SbcCD ATPase subunit